MTTLAGPDNSRASSAFWMLPPDRRPIGVSSVGVRISKACTSRRGMGGDRPRCSQPPVQNGAAPISLRRRLVATGKAPTVPSPSRSSVDVAQAEISARPPRSAPGAACRRAGWFRVAARRWPASASASCFWPLPSMPAMPRISPSATSRRDCPGGSPRSRPDDIEDDMSARTPGRRRRAEVLGRDGGRRGGAEHQMQDVRR